MSEQQRLSWPKGHGYDYFAPFVRATLISKNGTRLPIWTNFEGASLDGSAFRNVEERTGIGSIPFLVSAHVRITRGWVPHLSVTLTPPYREGLKLLDSIFADFAHTTLELTMGYFSSNALQTIISSPTWRGVTQPPKITIGTQMSITINAIGTGGFRAMNEMANSLPQKATRQKLIEYLFMESAQGHLSASDEATAADAEVSTAGSDPEAVERAFARVSAPRHARSLLNIDFSRALADTQSESARLLNEEVSISGSNKTNFDIALRLLSEAKCDFSFDTITAEGAKYPTDTLIVTPRETAIKRAKATFYAFDYPQGQVGPSVGIYPMLSASSATAGVFYSGHTLHTADMDSGDSGKINDVTIGSGKTDRSSDGTAVLDNESGHLSTGVAGWFGDPKAKGNIDRMRERLQAFTGGIGIAMDISTLGAPDIYPTDIVKLHGLGARFSGENHNYGVVVVEHTVDLNGFHTNLKLINNVYPSLRGSADGESAEQIGAAANKSPAPPQGGTRITARPTQGGLVEP